MPKHGVTGWGGWMLNRINSVFGIESHLDAIKKLMDDEESLSEDLQENQKQEQQLNEKLNEVRNKPNKGSPREGASIEGLDSEESTSNPADQVGSKVGEQTSPTPLIGKSWFMDEFGMYGSDVHNMLLKNDQEEMAKAIYPLIKEERKALLASYPRVDASLIEEIPFTDFDFNTLQKNEDTLRIPFLRFVKSWNDSVDHDERMKAYHTWHNRINKSERLSTREHKILSKCEEILTVNGSMNSQALQSQGVNSSPSEISMLIKSHGFLYGISSKGSGKTGQSYVYDIDRSDVVVKDVGGLLANLYENGGRLELGVGGSPRMILPFNSSLNKEYAVAINNEMGVRGVSAEGQGLVIEGETSVLKALEMTIDKTKMNGDLIVLLKALQGDINALKVVAYENKSPRNQVSLLKSLNMSVEKMKQIKEDIVNGY